MSVGMVGTKGRFKIVVGDGVGDQDGGGAGVEGGPGGLIHFAGCGEVVGLTESVQRAFGVAAEGAVDLTHGEAGLIEEDLGSDGGGAGSDGEGGRRDC